MSLKNVSAQLSKDGSPKILLTLDGKTVKELELIPADERHRNFILSTWVNSYKGQARRGGYAEFYDADEPRVAEHLWSDCTVATDDEGHVVFAWVCGYSGALYHCYVVPELRRLRVATRLIEASCGKVVEYARPWPYSAHARVNPYLLGKACQKR